jgi:hypothetical protein
MNRYKSPVVIFFLIGIMGCGGIPGQLNDTGATLLEECPENMDISLSDDKGAILTSIVVHMMDRGAWYFLLKELSTRSKYLMPLQPSKFAFQWGSYKSQPRSQCYVVQPGRYQFVKAYASREYRGSTIGGGTTSGGVRFLEYDYTERIQVQAGKVSYIGQLLIEDPRVKGKGFFGQWFAMLLAFGRYFPEDLEFSRTDESDDDVDWLEKNTKTQKTSVVNAVEF